jgi:hypothetical protein
LQEDTLDHQADQHRLDGEQSTGKPTGAHRQVESLASAPV